MADIGALGFVIFMTFKEPPHRGEQIAVVAGIYILILANLIYVYLNKSGSESGESWLSLYFKRKTLEEKKKIEALENRK